MPERFGTFFKERPGSAEAFINEIDRTSTLIADNPYLGHIVEGGAARVFVLSGFPYEIIHEIRDDLIVVVAFAHHSRRRGYWRKRLQSSDE